MTRAKIRFCACGRQMEPRMKVQCKSCSSHDQHRHRSRKAKRPQPMFVSVDGEGQQGPDGIMHLVTFSYGREDGTSDSISVPNLDGIQALDWLIDNLQPVYTDANGVAWKQVPVAFHFNWDTGPLLHPFADNLILVHKSTAKERGLLCWTNHPDDVSRETCKQFHRDDQELIQDILTEGGEGDLLAWHEPSKLAIATSPNRRFYVERRPNGDRFEGNQRLDIHDTGRAFMGGLEAVIDKYDPELRPDQREAIAWGKASRSNTFQDGTIEQISAYSEAECVAHARVCRMKLDRLRRATQIVMEPGALFGSGSIASAAFKFHWVPKRKDIHLEDAVVAGLTVEDIAQMTYFGGMIEDPVLGLIEQPVDEVDINSAYPSQSIKLPCMVTGHGRWHHDRGDWKDLPAPDSVGHVLASWSVQGTSTGPFIVRRVSGQVSQPLTGHRIWVTLPEFQTAYARFGDDVVSHETIWWVAECGCAPPLGFLADMYRARQDMKARMRDLEEGSHDWLLLDGEQDEIKLVINSAYGKCAQRRPDFGAYTNLHWASFITGATRAQVRRESWAREDQGGIVVYQHTDSVLSMGGAPCDGGKELGAWGMEHQSHRLLILQPGLAVALDGGKVASRGASRKAFIDAATNYAAATDLTQHPMTWPTLTIPRTMMVTRRMAIARGKPLTAGSFVDAPLTVSFKSQKRDIRAAYQMPGNPSAWIIPPNDLVEKVAELSDLKDQQSKLAKRTKAGEFDNRKL